MKIFILIIILTYSILYVNSQSNHEKYWFYRNRLKYFVSVGENEGESCIACIRNKNKEGILRFGQHLTHMGYYIGILATEYRLLLENSQFEDASNTLTELEYALRACDRLDKCEDKDPWNQSTWYYDGFIVREDVPIDFYSKHKELNRGLDFTQNIQYFSNINQKGMPAYVDTVNASINVYYSYSGQPDEWTFADERAISLDEIIGLLKGLALVKCCCYQGTWHYNKAVELATNMLKYMRNYDDIDPTNHW
ncbi:MAG: hypothetical protein ABIJ97_04655 [Bacteroidota bacterium]